MKSGWKDERGQALLMTALSLGMIFGILGLTADVGWAYYRQRAAQAAAEAAAIAAVKSAQTLSATFTCGTDLECPSTATACPSAPISSTLSPAYNSIQIGCYYANLDGFSQGGISGAQSVTMAAGTGTPTTVPNVSANYWVTARVSESISQLFSAINSGNNTLTASARATAGIINSPLSACAYLLGTSGTDVSTVGNSSFIATGCSVDVDSSSADAVDLKGASELNVGTLNVVGGVSNKGNYGSTVINTGVASFPDPLANVPAPTPGTCLASVHATHTVNLTPGTYCGGISGTGGSTINFAPGVYILLGGGLSTNGSVSGTGVMFYNTFNSTYAFSPISIAGGGTITLSAPTSGPYQSVLFFEDRNAPASTDSVEGSSSLNLVGNLYFKNSELDLGGSGSSTDVAVVANSLVLHGGGTFQSTQLSTAAAPSVPQLVLIE